MNTTLLVQLSGNTWEQIDLFEDIPITLTIQQNDLTNLTSRRVPYSRTIILPDTSKNSILFEHYFEINGMEFNPLQKISCLVQYRGTDIFQGVLRLNSVTTSTEERVYEIFIIGEVGDFTSSFRNVELQELTYTDLNHDHVYSSVTKSWECVVDGVSGLFGGQILYPLINYGLDYQGDSTTGATPTFSYDFDTATSFSFSGNPASPSMFKPAIQLKSVLDRIFSLTDYQVKSEFFDSKYFRSMYMDTFQNGKVGIDYASGVTNQNIFKAFGPNQQFRYKKDTRHQIGFSDTLNNGYDPLNNFTSIGGNTFRVPYSGLYGFNVRFNVNTTAVNVFTAILVPDITIQAWVSNDPNDITGGSMIYESPPIKLSQAFSLFGQDPLPVNLFFNDTLQAGQYLRIFVFDKTTFLPLVLSLPIERPTYQIQGYNDGTIIDTLPMFELYQSPTIITELVDMTLGIPNMTCFDFFTSLITLFNLVVVQDEVQKTIRIEPYQWFYDDNDRTIKDFTNIMDLNSGVKVEPLSFTLSKDLIWTKKFTDNEFLPKQFTDRFDFVYGRERFSSVSNIFVGEQIYEVPFGSCPTSGVTGAPNFIIPQFYYLNNQQQAPYSTIPHLFFWVGNRHAYKDNLKSIQGSWYLQSGSTPVEWSTYPCVSHLSTLESQGVDDVLSDLNFRSTFDFFANTVNQILQFTRFTLFNTFWRTYVDNLYDPFNKRLTGSFFIRPIDIYNTKINDKIWIKDSYFTIEKITDADLVNKRLTQISLIKDSIPYYRIDPPPPIYVLTPNESYPAVEPFYFDLAYISTDKDLVCNSTTPTLETFYSFGTGTLGNLDQVYLNTGTSFILLPMGTFIRQTTSPTTFVVVDNYGRVLETTC